MKIIVYDCYRTLLYAPIYYLGAYRSEFDFPHTISFGKEEQKGTISGDTQALLYMLNSETAKERISVAVCDPVAVFTDQYNLIKRYRDVLLVATLINKIAIWLVTIAYLNPSNQKEIDHNSKVGKLIDLFSHGIDKITEELQIYFYPNSRTTAGLFRSRYSINGKIKASHLGTSDFKDEIDCLIEGNVLLTNSPWLCEAAIKADPRNLQLVRLDDAGPRVTLFTGLVTKIAETKGPKERVLIEFIRALQRSVRKFYDEPVKYAKKLKEIPQLASQFVNLGHPDLEDAFKRTCRELAHQRIYEHTTYTTFESWKNLYTDIWEIKEQANRRYEELVANIFAAEAFSDSLETSDER